MDSNAKNLKSTDAAKNLTIGKKVQQPDIVGRLEQLEGAFLDGLQHIRQIKSELTKRFADTGTLDHLLDAEELAPILNVEVKHVYSLARNNRIPSVMIGKYRKFVPSHVVKWLN